jgi:prolyl 4-hydroxylase
MQAQFLASLMHNTGHHAADILLAQVDSLDAHGKHQEAVDLLAKATRQNNVAAKTALALRLIYGDRAPQLPGPGVEFLLEAAASGSGEAAAQAAVFMALGLYVPQNWRGALDMLGRSAANGWTPAQGQLLALATDFTLIEKACEQQLTAAEWHAVGGSIDLDYWLAPASGIFLSEDPVIKQFPDFIPAITCQWLIELARDKLERAQVYSSADKNTEVSDNRTNSCAVFSLRLTDMVNVLVQARMAAAANTRISHMEAATVLHYSIGQEIKPHYDFIHPRSPDYEQQIAVAGQRNITFLVYLNDDYAGGETEFVKLGIRHKGKTGSAIYFINTTADQQPDLRTQHAGCPPTSSEKWLVSQFIRNSMVIPLPV